MDIYYYCNVLKFSLRFKVITMHNSDKSIKIKLKRIFGYLVFDSSSWHVQYQINMDLFIKNGCQFEIYVHMFTSSLEINWIRLPPRKIFFDYYSNPLSVPFGFHYNVKVK